MHVKEVRAATHASRNQILAAIQSCDYVVTAMRLLYRVSKVIHSKCYGFDDDNSQIGPPNGKQIEGNAGSSSSNTPPQGSGALSTPKHNDKVDPLGAETHDKNSGPRAKLITVPRSKQLWYAQLRILCVQRRQ
jgi:hypothetical protein